MVQLSNAARAALGGVAAFDLLWRVPVSIAEVLPIWTVAVVSVGAGQTGSALLAQATTWLLLGVTFFVFAGTMYPEDAQLPVEATGFRLLVSGFGIAFGAVFALSDEDAILELMIALLSLSVVGGIAFATYLSVVRGWRLRAATPRTTGPMQVIADEDQQEQYAELLSSESAVSDVIAGFFIASTAGLVVFPCVLLGLLTRVLVNAYPLADLIVIGAVVTNAVQGGRLPSVTGLDAGKFDIQERLYRGIDTATMNLKGTFLVVLAVNGAFFSAGTVAIGLQVVTSYLNDAGVRQLPVVALQDPLSLWNVGGLALSLLAAGLYGFWVWLRTFVRLETFVEAWGDDRERWLGRTQPARPAGLTAVPAAVMTALGVHIDLDSDVALAVTLPVLIGLCIVGVVLTRRRSGSPAAREDHIVLLTFLVHSGSLAATLVGTQIVRVVTAPIAFCQSLLYSPLPMLLAATVGLVYLGDVGRYSERFDDWRRHLHGLYFVAYGVALWLTSLPAGPNWQGAGLVILVVCVCFAVIGTVVDVLEARADIG